MACVDLTVAAGDAEWDEGLRWVAPLRAMGVTPHVAQQVTWHRGSGVHGRTTRHAGYARSPRIGNRWRTISCASRSSCRRRRRRHRGHPAAGWPGLREPAGPARAGGERGDATACAGARASEDRERGSGHPAARAVRLLERC